MISIYTGGREGRFPLGPSVGFRILACSPAGTWDASIPIAAARAGAIGLLDLTYLDDVGRAAHALGRLNRLAKPERGVVVSARLGDVEREAQRSLDAPDMVLLVPDADADFNAAAETWRPLAKSVGVVVMSSCDLAFANCPQVDFLVVKGNEAGGEVGDKTTFVLLQQVLNEQIGKPVYAWGGIGTNTAVACRVAGAAGVVLDWQLSLMRESPLPAAIRRRIRRMDGTETATLRTSETRELRYFCQPGMSAHERFQTDGQGRDSAPTEAAVSSRRACFHELLCQPTADARLWLVSQDACWAANWSSRTPTVGKAIARLREAIEASSIRCLESRAMTPGGGVAASHGTEFPIVQGPMTRVSDTPEFCQAVGEAGALPFLALALMRGQEVSELLARTQELMGGRPWGVGILGFVSPELRAEQLAAIETICPPFAIIAGGRPDQATSLEAKGISTYLHVPSPEMLKTFVEQGARRFIFEGRECGGHIGPRSSFVLWETMTNVLTDLDLGARDCEAMHILYAGGICDGLSGAMVSAIGQPLVDRGMNIGALLGTAYVFTHEAVSTGAIVEGFQSVACGTERTVVVESGGGHAIRCAPSPYTVAFERQKESLRRAGRSAEQIREELDQTNIGRLRIASKGVKRAGQDEPTGRRLLQSVSVDEQFRDGMYMIGQIAAICGKTCSVRELHERVCGGTHEYLRSARQYVAAPKLPLQQKTTPPPLDIAIVGMSCLLPGADTVAEFWQNILDNRDLLEAIPSNRFDIERWYDPDRGNRDGIYANSGGFLKPIPFDPIKYGIPPASLKSIEPVQLLALELVDRALQDAGYGGYEGDNPIRDRTSIILGAGGGAGELSTRYVLRAALPHYFTSIDKSMLDRLPEWTEDSFAGILMNVIAGRVANRFDLGGVNYTVDAACASSLAAIYLACRELADGTSDMVIAGGCDTGQTPFGYLCFASAGALSPRGKSRSFDASADGISISEGLASVVLKRVADAQRDGDRIYAVIRAAAGGSDGRSKGMTAPRLEGQVRAFRRAYGQAGFSPATVALFEAHGTGTALGDATECQSLTKILEEDGAPVHNSAIGSVKSNIGHTKCTAGVAGLMKAALALHHGVLAPTTHVESLAPTSPLIAGPLYVNTELRPWIRSTTPRRAAVSSFGFGGTNFHVVLEDYESDAVDVRPVTTRERWPTEIFLFTGKSKADLLARIERLATDLAAAHRSPGTLRLADLASSIYDRVNQNATARAAVVASDVEDLLARLNELQQTLKAPDESSPLPNGIYFCDAPLGVNAPLAMVFPGQGSQFPNMVRDLAVEFPICRGCFDRADAIAGATLTRPLSRYVFPTPTFCSDERSGQFEALKSTDVAQPALGASTLAVQRLLQSLGVTPQLVAGHSYGELVALHVAGCLDEDALYRLSLARGRAMANAAGRHADQDLGSMVAVNANEQAVRAIIARCPDVWIANLNSPTQTVISGSTSGLARAVKASEDAGLRCIAIPVGCAFHTPMMAAAKDSFEDALKAEGLSAPRMPVWSNVSAKPYASQPSAISEALAEQILSPVRFVELIESMYDAGARIFLEAGPGDVLTRLVRDILGDHQHITVATHPRGEHGLTGLLNALAQLFVHGVPMDLALLFDARGAQSIDLRRLTDDSDTSREWLVDGAHAWRADEQPPTAVPLDLAAVSARDAVSTANVPHDGVRHEDEATSKPITPVLIESNVQNMSTQDRSPSPASSASQLDGNDPYVQFQQTMRQFLETQQSVMTAFLGAETLPSRPALPQAIVPLEEPANPSPPAPSDLSDVRPPSQSTLDLEAVLCDIVSERTGYPPDMLELGIDLESELGIDSIKRVEIVSAFRRAVLPSIDEPPAWFMEQMTAARTMQEILAGVGTLLGEPEAAAQEPNENSESTPDAMASLPESSASPASDQNLSEILTDIVSQRTGYPPDMLELDIDLESELGIDSIKRVEIVSAFRRAVLPSIDEPPAWFMEQMTAARTMQEILAGVGTLLGEPEAAAQEPNENSESTPDAMASLPESSASPASDQNLSEILTDIVSQRTGYPPDMLELDINLESELGIDSIKRVEIISAFRRIVLPTSDEPPSWFMEKMTAARTMQEILDGVCELIGGDAGADRPRPANAEICQESIDPLVPRCVVNVVESRIEKAEYALPENGVVLITDDAEGHARSLAAEWVGVNVERLTTDDLRTRQAAEEAIERIRSRHARIAGVVHLQPLSPATAFPEISAAAWSNFYDAEVKSALYLLQALAPELKRGIFFSCVTRWGGDFGTDDILEGAYAWRGGLAGMLKCAAKEWPGSRFRLIDVDSTGPGSLSTTLRQEWAVDGPVEVGYRDGRRLVLQALPQNLDSELASESMLDESSVILLTGGARGITAQIAIELAERVQPTLILLGRSPLPSDDEPVEMAGLADRNELRAAFISRARRNGTKLLPKEIEGELSRLLAAREIRSTLAAISRAGGKPVYVPCDVRDAQALESTVANIERQYGPINAIVHGAGVLDDKWIVEKTSQSFDYVVETKVAPLLTLARVLDPSQLKLTMLFASVAGFFGNPGQCDYAAANEMLNRMARRLSRRWPGKTVAMNWGPWDGTGMVTPEVAEQFAERGVSLIPIDAGRRAAWMESRHSRPGDVRILVGSGQWTRDVKRLSQPPISTSHSTPLLNGAEVRSLGDDELEAQLILASHDHPLLRDHEIDGTPVLPFAVAVEMMAEFAAVVQPHLHVTRLENIRQFRGILVPQATSITVRARVIERTTHSAQWSVKVFESGNTMRPCYEAAVTLSESPERPPRAPTRAAVLDNYQLTAHAAYDAWLFHGPAFQIIEKIIGCGDVGIDALVRPSCPQLCGPRGNVGEWIIDPVVLDAVPQLAIVWSRALHDTTPLPNYLESYEHFGPLQLAPIEIAVRVDAAADADAFRADVWLIQDETVVGILRGLEGASSAALNRLSQPVESMQSRVP